jgi:hypothetical protein
MRSTATGVGRICHFRDISTATPDTQDCVDAESEFILYNRHTEYTVPTENSDT